MKKTPAAPALFKRSQLALFFRSVSTKTTDSDLAAHLAGLIKIIKDAISLAERRAEYSEAYFAQKARDCQTTLEGWLAFCESYEDDELRKLAKHMKKHLYEWFTFLTFLKRNPTMSC